MPFLGLMEFCASEKWKKCKAFISTHLDKAIRQPQPISSANSVAAVEIMHNLGGIINQCFFCDLLIYDIILQSASEFSKVFPVLRTATFFGPRVINELFTPSHSTERAVFTTFH